MITIEAGDRQYELVEGWGQLPAGWQWGRLHRITFGHVLGLASPALAPLAPPSLVTRLYHYRTVTLFALGQ